MPPASAAALTKITADSSTARPKAANIGREYTGWGVGIEAFGSPIWLMAILPPSSTISGFTPKKAGDHSTRSARLPSSMLPISWAIPWAMAGLMVYFAM